MTALVYSRQRVRYASGAQTVRAVNPLSLGNDMQDIDDRVQTVGRQHVETVEFFSA